MPRPKKDGAAEPKRRSRNGCWPCKARKVKCGEEKPQCLNCERQNEACDYSIRLNWSGRAKRDEPDVSSGSGAGSSFSATFVAEDSMAGTLFFPSFEQLTSQESPASQHARSRSNTSVPAASVPPSNPPVNIARTQEAPRAVPSIPVDPRIQDLHGSYGLGYPSPSTSSFENPYSANGLPSVVHAPKNATAFHLPSFQDMSAMASPEHRSKRLRLSPSNDTPTMSPPSRNSYGPVSDRRYVAISPMEPHSPFAVPPMGSYSPFSNPPLTPGSSIASEESNSRLGTRVSLPSYPGSTDPRRLSVNDLLVDANSASSGILDRTCQLPPIHGGSGTTTYGYDIGQPDEDTPKNDDASAISLFSPPVSYSGLPCPNSEESTDSHRRQKSIAFEADGYYAKPVPIKIPNTFSPLPSTLLKNQMNLLYFHHFLNHTARILVPHDCERNPFRSILPQLAVHDDDLLGLLLAYSASHRARLLCHPEPANRIAVWVQDVFPKLRRALDSAEQISKTNLTTAIMLASLEIISPNAFEVPVSWQDHLTVAREMIVATGGLRPRRSRKDRDDVQCFLSTWFAYLDVLGSLSGSKNDLPLSLASWSRDSGAPAGDGDGDGDGGDSAANNDNEIDCLLGFTPRYIAILARIAELAKHCEAQRFDADGNVREGWSPSPDVVADAEEIRVALVAGAADVYKGCAHGGDGDNTTGTTTGTTSSSSGSGSTNIPAHSPTTSLSATNTAFHHAALIHLHRRVLGRPSHHRTVQSAAHAVLSALRRIPPGSTAEACLLFPMFSAGCEVRGEAERGEVLERLRSVERCGMSQVGRARRVMQRVWGTGRAWEGLVEGEFFG